MQKKKPLTILKRIFLIFFYSFSYIAVYFVYFITARMFLGESYSVNFGAYVFIVWMVLNFFFVIKISGRFFR